MSCSGNDLLVCFGPPIRRKIDNPQPVSKFLILLVTFLLVPCLLVEEVSSCNLRVSSSEISITARISQLATRNIASQFSSEAVVEELIASMKRPGDRLSARLQRTARASAWSTSNYEKLQIEAYRNARQKTAEMVAQGQVPQAVPRDFPALDISLVAGHRSSRGAQSDFSQTFLAPLTVLGQALESVSDAYRAESTGHLHLTLFELLHRDHDPDFLDHLASDQLTEWWEKCNAAARVVRDFQSFIAWFKGPTLMPNGTVIIEGYADNPVLEELRNRLSALFLEEDWTNRYFFQITLSRPSRLLTLGEWKKVYRWTLKQEQSLGKIQIRHPLLLATRNQFATQFNEPLNNRLNAILQAVPAVRKNLSKEAA